MGDHNCSVELLGGLRVQQGERSVTRFRMQKIGSLLAYLAYYPRRTHTREELIELLWPECDLDAGRNRLSVALSSLRHQLEPPGVAAGTIIRADRTSVQLNPAVVSTDVAAFAQLRRTAAQERNATSRRDALTRAVELYRGPLLPGYYEEWVLAEQEHLATAYVQVLGELTRLLEASGDGDAALEYACRGLQVDPLREELHREVIRFHAASGRIAEALRQYHELERTLRSELGTSPSAPLRQLARQLEQQEHQSPPGPHAASSVRQAPPARPAPPPAEPAPAGTVTFLLAAGELGDVPHAGRPEWSEQQCQLRRVVQRHRGHLVKETADTLTAVFAAARDALRAAVAAQRALAARSVPAADGDWVVKMALHTGDVDPHTGDYRGETQKRAAALLAAAHGGEILCSAAVAVLLRSEPEPAFRLQDLGLYRVHGAAEPERLFQVDIEGQASREFPPPRARAGHTGHLPPALNRFFGRENELAQLQQWLDPAAPAPRCRLVTLLGPGGTGKTRLALEAASRLVERFTGAVWFVPLADLRDGNQIADTILRALRAPRSVTKPVLEQLAEVIENRPSLLVLDNFEQLVENGAVFLRELLERIPPLTCLVTSRQLLNIAGERPFTVGSLPTPGSTLEPVQLCAIESVQLFVDRAQSVRPDFQITRSNAAAVAELCTRLEGLPLAVELAAARAQVLTPGQMLAQLTHRFEFLSSRRRDVTERQRTLWGAVDWSYQLLTPELQQFFARLAVFRGGWEVAAAEEVCTEPLALDHLCQLHECSLVQVEETGTGSADEGARTPRFRMLETLREFAERQLASECRGELQQRHLRYYGDLAEAAEPHLTTADQGIHLRILDAERENLRAALDTALQGENVEAALRLSAALWRFWSIRGYVPEGRAFLTAALARVPASPQLEMSTLRARALDGAGALAHDAGDYGVAAAYHVDSIRLWREAGDRCGLATALNSLANASLDAGDTGAAHAAYEEALALYRQLGDTRGTAMILGNLGTLLHLQGEDELAAGLLEESITLKRDLGNRYGLAISLDSLGSVEQARGNGERALNLRQEALFLQRELGHKQGIAMSLNNLGALYLAQGAFEEAASTLWESLELFRDLEDQRSIAECLDHLAGLTTAEGDAAGAVRLHAVAAALRERQGITLPPRAAAELEAAHSHCQTALGEAGFAAAWRQGAEARLHDVVNMAPMPRAL